MEGIVQLELVCHFGIQILVSRFVEGMIHYIDDRIQLRICRACDASVEGEIELVLFAHSVLQREERERMPKVLLNAFADGFLMQ